MAQRTVVETIAGATLAVSASIPITYDEAGYSDTGMVYTLVGEVENYGNHGVVATIVEFTPVDTSVVTKLKGSKNYGTMACTLGNLPSDAGQAIFKLAAESNNHYSIKLTYPDTEVQYLDVIVGSFEYVDGAVNDVQKVNVSLALARAPVIVPQV